MAIVRHRLGRLSTSCERGSAVLRRHEELYTNGHIHGERSGLSPFSGAPGRDNRYGAAYPRVSELAAA